MKRLSLKILSLASVLILSGCSLTQPKVVKPAVDPELPKVNDVKVIEDISTIGFEWQGAVDPRVKGYVVFRSNPQDEGGKLAEIDRVADRFATHYVDRKLQPNTKYFYRFATYTDDGVRSEPGKTIKTQTLPMIKSVSFIKAIQTLPRRVKLIWRPHTSRSVESYIIERKIAGEEWSKHAEIPNRLSAEYIDRNLEDNSVYNYRIRVKMYNGLISAPSEVVTAQTKPLPPMITKISATNDQPKQITVEWSLAKVEDFSHYKLYRKSFFWSYHAKVKQNRFVDRIDEDGESYEYKVSVVDKDGLESLHSVVVRGTTLPKPPAPKIGLIKMDEKSIYLQWHPSGDRAESFILIKNGERVLNNLTNTVYTDRDVQPGKEYNYSVIAVDEYGLTSEPSEEASLFLPMVLEKQ